MRLAVRQVSGRVVVKLVIAGCVAVIVLAPVPAAGQVCCPDDIPAIRLGIENLLKLRTRHYMRHRRVLALERAGGADLRVLRGRAARPACGRLMEALPPTYRAARSGDSLYDIVFYRVLDRYLVAVRRARARNGPLVPQLPDRLISFDLDFEEIGSRTF